MAETAATPANVPDGYELIKKRPVVPEEWPGAFGAYKYSRDAIRSNIWIFVWIFLAGIPLFVLSWLGDKGGIFIIFTIIYYVLNIILQIAYYEWTLSVAQGKKLNFQEIINYSAQPNIVLNLVGLYVLLVPILVFSFLLFIVPFFIVFPRLILATFYVLDKKLNCVEALQASWNDTKGYSGIIWGTIGATVAMIMLAFTIVGFPFSIYFLIMYSAISAIVYEYIKKKGPAVKTLPATQPARA